MRAISVLLLPLLIASACAVFGSADTSADNADGGDGTESDAASEAPSDAADAPLDGVADSGVQTLGRDDFEGSSVACSDWSGFGATAFATTTAAHGGVRSCQICNPTGKGAFAQKVVRAVGPGVYSFDAWARQDSDAGVWSGTLQALVDGSPETTLSNTLPVVAEWRPVQVTVSTAVDADAVVAMVTLAPTSCIDMDDVEITYAP